jgi:hypothetical protein
MVKTLPCALAGSLLIAGTMTFLLPKKCDLAAEVADNAVGKEPRSA